MDCSRMSNNEILTVLVFWILFVVIGVYVGNAKGRATAGALLAMFLGVIGVIVVAVMPPTPERQAADDLKRKGQAPKQAVSATDVEAQLLALGRMFEAGHVDKADYEEQRKRILAQLKS